MVWMGVVVGGSKGKAGESEGRWEENRNVWRWSKAGRRRRWWRRWGMGRTGRRRWRSAKEKRSDWV